MNKHYLNQLLVSCILAALLITIVLIFNSSAPAAQADKWIKITFVKNQADKSHLSSSHSILGCGNKSIKFFHSDSDIVFLNPDILTEKYLADLKNICNSENYHMILE
ncbi:MAG: hypothetical protein IT280_01650 [Ignavibacteria bacterium]|nr:hypothetical protein [Ignavibacteria bacterium]